MVVSLSLSGHLVREFQIQKLSFAEEWNEDDEDDDEESNSSFKKEKSETTASTSQETDKNASIEGKDDENSGSGGEDSGSGSKFFKKRFGKNPNVDTSFLPDKEREEEDNRLR